MAQRREPELVEHDDRPVHKRGAQDGEALRSGQILGHRTWIINAPVVSVVVPTRDSAANLARCLASLESQAVELEAIVVDQESSDDTASVAANAGAVLVSTARPDLYAPPTRSRNLGAERAGGEYLLHLDADMTLAPGALAKAVGMSSAGVVALVFEEVDVADGYWARCKALERTAYRGSTLLEAARFVRASVFHEVGGYDESLGSGEDWDIHARYARKGSIGRVPNAIFHHLGAVSWHGQVSKKFAYGRSTRNFRAKHGLDGYSHEMLAAYARNWTAFVRDPAHSLGFLALRASEAVAAAGGLALESLRERRG